MTFDLHVYDPNDNPYMPLRLQDAVLNLDPGHFDFLHPLPVFPTHGASPVHGIAPVVSDAGLVDDDAESLLDDIDDNSSEALVPIEDHDFPSYFAEHGSPQRLFHSHGSYSLPVDGDEMKVRLLSSAGKCLCRHSTWFKMM
jgi:hypothetical protein